MSPTKVQERGRLPVNQPVLSHKKKSPGSFVCFSPGPDEVKAVLGDEDLVGVAPAQRHHTLGLQGRLLPDARAHELGGAIQVASAWANFQRQVQFFGLGISLSLGKRF